MKMIGEVLNGCPACAASEMCKSANIEPNLENIEKLEAKIREIRKIVREAQEDESEK